MNGFVKALTIFAFVVASSAAVAESPDERVPNAALVSSAPVASVVVPEDTPIAFKEISGIWIGKDTGGSGAFYFRDIRIFETGFTADFFIQSASRSACDVNVKIHGIHFDGVLEFSLQRTVCGKAWGHRGALNTSESKGGYVSGHLSGWYVVKNAQKPDT